jgi:CHASE1-domain containing sensor protein
MKQFSHLLQTLKETPDGAGNLLDSAVILASSDTADGKEHTLQDYPIVVAGRAHGALKHPGVHYRSDSKENSSKVLLSILRAAGLPLKEFGSKGGHVTDSLGAIEA